MYDVKSNAGYGISKIRFEIDIRFIDRSHKNPICVL